LNKAVPVSEDETELTKLKLVIDEKSKKLEEAELELKKLKKSLTPTPKTKVAKTPVQKVKSGKKTTSK
jgi:hypothetical protein